MSDIQPYQEAESLPGALVTDSPLVLWAQEASAAHRIAQSLVKTSFVPRAMQGRPDEATAAILTGQEVGLQPMAALRSINIIQGTPAMSAMAMRALVQSHGHEVWVDEQTNTRAVVRGRRKGTEQVQASTWTIDRAKQLGLTGKDNWTKQPQAMLVARATSECCRLIAADVLLGLPYSAEELADQEPMAEQEPPRRTAKRRPLERAASDMPEIETPAEPVVDIVADEPVEVEWPEPAQPGGAE